MRIKRIIKLAIAKFLVGVPYGLYGKVCDVENNQVGKYTLWDKTRFRLLTGKSLTEESKC